ncbi:MAG: ATP-binding protein, partial [bacterium]
GQITAAAYLLFGENPQVQFPEAYVRVIRYRGIERGTGRSQQVLRDTRLEGHIPRILHDAAEEIRALQPVRRALGQSGRFEGEHLIPEDAWLEGLVNAVVHRSYSIGGDHVRVEIFDDRIELESPGRFPGIVNPKDPLKITRFARNPRIARVCADLDFGQELGEGIRRIYSEMRAAGLGDPLYRQTAASVHLTLSSMAVDRELLDRLPARSGEILAALRQAERMSTGDLAEVLDITRPSVLVRLRILQHEGLIEWVGTSPKDPRAYWRIRR